MVSSVYLRFGCLWLISSAFVGCGADVDVPDHVEPQTERVTPSTAQAEPGTLIVAMGDSLTEGLNVDPEQAYPAQLERRLRVAGYDVKVINAGIAGETSTGALSRADWILKLKPDIVILETGANDGLRGVDPQLTERNLDELIRRFRDEKITVVLAGMQIVQNMGRHYADAFRDMFPRLAEKHAIELIPFFLEGVAADPTLNQADGIHPTAQGYTVVVELVLPEVLKVLGDETKIPAKGAASVPLSQ
jgi:acyl-CoA thioesterase-1